MSMMVGPEARRQEKGRFTILADFLPRVFAMETPEFFDKIKAGELTLNSAAKIISNCLY